MFCVKTQPVGLVPSPLRASIQRVFASGIIIVMEREAITVN
ncbi:MAG: hypothetical protein QGH66_05175 [Dehalococcoidia bacterium]|nr:hypothetical protein [Dehalococcoidia bacterium]